MEIRIFPRTVLKVFLYLIGILLILHLGGLISRRVLEQKFIYDLRPLFDFNQEMNLPTFFSSIALLISSLLLATIAWLKWKLDSEFFPWLGLASIFLYLSFDEIAALHERLDIPIRGLLNTSGVLFFSWIIPYGVGLILLTLVLLKFFLRLPRKTQKLFFISGLVFVSGAIGFEMIGARHYEIHGGENLTYELLCTGEELLEMTGVTFFIYALLLYLKDHFSALTITIQERT